MRTVSYSRELEVRGSYDILVAGSGPAGICAAVAAAREGARVALIERYGVVGGNLTTGYVGPILGMVGKGTMRDELVELLGVPENDMIGETGRAHDFEMAKIRLMQFVNHPNIDVYLQTTVTDVIKEGDTLKGIIATSGEGQFALLGKVTIDATGDGIVSYLAGATTEKGREDGLMQPVTLEFTIDGWVVIYHICHRIDQFNRKFRNLVSRCRFRTKNKGSWIERHFRMLFNLIV